MSLKDKILSRIFRKRYGDTSSPTKYNLSDSGSSEIMKKFVADNKIVETIPIEESDEVSKYTTLTYPASKPTEVEKMVMNTIYHQPTEPVAEEEKTYLGAKKYADKEPSQVRYTYQINSDTAKYVPHPYLLQHTHLLNDDIISSLPQLPNKIEDVITYNYNLTDPIYKFSRTAEYEIELNGVKSEIISKEDYTFSGNAQINLNAALKNPLPQCERVVNSVTCIQSEIAADGTKSIVHTTAAQCELEKLDSKMKTLDPRYSVINDTPVLEIYREESQIDPAQDEKEL